MTLVIFSVVACALALFPALLMVHNVRLYAAPPPARRCPVSVSILIPARNEAGSIEAAVTAALASTDVVCEVVVVDDHSTDATAEIVRRLMAADPRVRLLPAPPLPCGWNGKQHACAVLATEAQYPLMVFVDADVRLHPQGLARLVAFLAQSGAALVSGIPRQEMGSWLEGLLIPLIHFLLLGFLPIQRMRHSTHPSYGSGCGQLVLVQQDAYARTGGHGAIRTSLHDGVTLPRAFRVAGYKTDLCDATPVATCRMYHDAREVWHGLAKNATEGLAAPALIFPATGILLGGQVMPLVLAAVGVFTPLPIFAWACVMGSILAVYATRFRLARRFDQPLFSVWLHPVSILLLLMIQWYAYGRALCGYAATWKGRTYAAGFMDE